MHLHQHKSDGGVEHHPHHTPGVAVGEAREKIAPGQRTGIGVGDVDLELRHHHKHRRQRHCRAVGQPGLERGQVHLVGIGGALGRQLIAQHQHTQERTAQHLEHAGQHPARPTHHHRCPPAPAPPRLRRRHKPQVIGLLAHLGDERHAHGQRRTKMKPIKTSQIARRPTMAHQLGQCTRFVPPHPHKSQQHQAQPQPLGPDLKARNGRHPVCHQRNHHQRAQQIAPHQRYAQRQLQRVGHDGRLQRKKDEGERGVNQGCERRAQIAKPRAPGEQIHVHPMARSGDADGQPGHKNDETGAHNGQRRIHKTVLQQQGGANGFEHQKRRCAKCGVGHLPARHAAGALRRVAQGVVFQRVAADPTVVVAAHRDDALWGSA